MYCPHNIIQPLIISQRHFLETFLSLMGCPKNNLTSWAIARSGQRDSSLGFFERLIGMNLILKSRHPSVCAHRALC